jgi:predicted nucleic acid-binding protein
MSGRIFIDSNIFIYALDNANKKKNTLAKEAFRRASEDFSITISTQVLNEVYAVATRKLGIDPLAAKEFLHVLFGFDVVLITKQIIESAIDCSILNKVSYWDALMISAAENSQCSQLWTEDLQSQGVIRGVQIINPFSMLS